jgi:hypothetical protein
MKTPEHQKATNTSIFSNKHDIVFALTWSPGQYGCFESFPFRQIFFIFVRQITWFRWNVKHWTSAVIVHNKTPIDMRRFNVRSSTLKKS